MKKLIFASAIGMLMAIGASAQATGTLTITGNIQGSMTLTLNNDVSGATITGAGSSAGSIAFGTVSASTSDGTVASGIAKSTVGGGNWQLNTTVDVYVTSNNVSSLSYTLAANIDNTDELGYVVNAVPLTTLSQTVASNQTYSTNHAIPVQILVPSTATSAAINRVITFTATAN